jgi:sortase A
LSRGARATLAVVSLGVALGAGGQAAWIPVKARLAQWLVASAWAAAGDRQKAPAPWPWADTRPVARLWLPGRRDPLFVLSGASGRTLAFGPGHDPASVLPGEPGNSVIAGHRDTHFAALGSLEVGQRLLLETAPGAVALEFVVVSLDVADSRVQRLRLDAPGRRLSLVTCWPLDAVDPGGPLRYVVTAEAR